MELPGDVGIILRPTAADQVLSVASTDSGSSELESGEELSGGVPLTAESFEDTFKVAVNDYNEWRIRGAEVVGIFVASANNVRAKALQPIVVDGVTIGETIAPRPFSITEIRNAFPDLEVITIGPEGLCELSGPQQDDDLSSATDHGD